MPKKQIKVFGYVDTNYGRVALDTATRNIDSYYSWIGVDGIFFDQCAQPLHRGVRRCYN